MTPAKSAARRFGLTGSPGSRPPSQPPSRPRQSNPPRPCCHDHTRRSEQSFRTAPTATAAEQPAARNGGSRVLAVTSDSDAAPYLFQRASDLIAEYLGLSSICRRLRGKHRSPVTCVPRLASAEQRRSAQDGDLVWAAAQARRGRRLVSLGGRGRPCAAGGRPAGQRCPLARAGLRRDAFITARPDGGAVSIMPDPQAWQRLSGWVRAAGLPA
jgi:hypothetical protein